jgi:hypothetical protein
VSQNGGVDLVAQFGQNHVQIASVHAVFDATLLLVLHNFVQIFAHQRAGLNIKRGMKEEREIINERERTFEQMVLISYESSSGLKS